MNIRKQTLKYLACDFIAAVLSWASLFAFRKLGLEHGTMTDIATDPNFWVGIALVPAGWLCLYAIQGIYRDVYRKGRLKELQQTLASTLIGALVVFFALLIDDDVTTYSGHYLSLLFLFGVHFVFTYVPRVLITTHTANLVHTRQLGFPTLLIGSKDKAYHTYLDLDNQEVYSGNLFVGFMPVNGSVNDKLAGLLPCMGSLDRLREIVAQHQVKEVIIAIEDYEENRLTDIIRTLDRCEDLVIKVTPNLRDIIFGSVRLDSIFHSPLLVVNPRLMPEWQSNVKRIADIVVSMLALVILSPIYLLTAIAVKASSPGPVFYAQERIGKNGRPFKMHKFRSMYVDAEKSGPQLSRDDDPRITPFGRFMRKVRLDEIPQFWNVLRGTMSLVGPRPERQFFIDQIVQRAPEYLLLQRIKPGITSWGQVKYGYAENVDEMVERLRYDLLYLENMTLATDIKILIYTIIIVVQGRGK